MAKFSVLDRLHEVKKEVIERGADPDQLALILSDLSHFKLCWAVSDMSGETVSSLKEFDGMEIRVHPQCSDDQIFIVDKRHWKL